MKIYANTNYSEFEQYLAQDLWVLATIHVYYPPNIEFDVQKYINIIKVDKQYDMIVYLQVDAEIFDQVVESGNPVLAYERDDIETALHLSSNSNYIIENESTIQSWNDEFPRIVKFNEIKDVTINHPVEMFTSAEIQEMLDMCPEEQLLDDEDIEDEDLQ